MENSGNILIFSDIYDTRSGRDCNVTLLTEDSQSLRDLADRAGIWTELEERHPGLTPGRILQGDHAVFGCIVIHDNLRTHGEFGLEFAGAAEVAVYAKLPRGFQIPTPVGNYAPVKRYGDLASAYGINVALNRRIIELEARTEAVRRGIRDGGADGDGDGKASPKKMLKILNRSLKYMKRANKELVKVLKDAGRKSRQPLLDPSPNESKQGSVDIESEGESACGTASDL